MHDGVPHETALAGSSSLFLLASLISFLAVVSGASPVVERVVAAEACPANPPPGSYALAAIDWVRMREGSALSTLASRPISTGVPHANPFDSPVPIPSPTPIADWPYVVLDNRYVYFSELSSCYVALTILNQETGQIDKLLVDLTSHEVHPAGEIDELQIQSNLNGGARVDPELAARLNYLKPGETVPVMVWLRTPRGKDLASRQRDAYMRLAETFPEAKAAMEEFGNPFGVQDEGLLRTIRTEYDRLMSETVDNDAMSEVTDLLNKQGVLYRSLSPMPAIVIDATREAVDTMTANSYVERLYLTEARTKGSLRDAGQTHRISNLGALGLDGSGTMIGILEAGNVQQSNRYMEFYPDRLVSGNGDQPHATDVAACAASFYNDASGSAPRARIISAGTTTEQFSAMLGLQWVSGSPYWTDTVNHSEAICTGTAIQGITRAFDYWARGNNTVITVAAGNSAGSGGDGEYVCSPANGYNVVSVGSFNNQDTQAWGDDTMSGFSSWRDPVSPYGDREKPDVVAVGEHLTIWGAYDMLWYDKLGTSLSAPQVAGLSAALTKQNGQLRHLPEVVKAILAASAMHNIEGEAVMAGATDTRDGAGGIDGDWAATVAKANYRWPGCRSSCWSVDTTYGLAPGGSRSISFWALSGQRVRCALAWWATADSEPYAAEVLDKDLDLRVRVPSSPNYGIAFTSTSFDNNLELVDFTAPETGWYTLEVVKALRTRADAPETPYGVAIVTTRPSYLPLVLHQ